MRPGCHRIAGLSLSHDAERLGMLTVTPTAHRKYETHWSVNDYFGVAVSRCAIFTASYAFTTPPATESKENGTRVDGVPGWITGSAS